MLPPTGGVVALSMLIWVMALFSSAEKQPLARDMGEMKLVVSSTLRLEVGAVEGRVDI